MELIKEKDLYIIDELCSREINIDEFRIQSSFQANFEQIRYLLYRSKDEIEDHCNKYTEAIFWRLPKDITKQEEVILFREFILVNWHCEHEEMATAFQIDFHDDIVNIDVLIKAFKNPPSYLLEDDFRHSYLRKLIYAIGAQPSPQNIQALESLLELEDDYVKGLVKHQIEKRNKYGRWEAGEKK